MTRGTIPGMTHGIDPGHDVTTGTPPTTTLTEKMRLRLPALLLSISWLLLAGCSSTPKFDSARYDPAIDPAQAAASFNVHQNKNLLWGGRLVSVANLADGTQLEVLAHPLTSSQIPNTNKPSTGRFIVLSGAFLEPLDFVEGRLITVAGRLNDLQHGQVGAVQYQYPVLNSDNIYLWSNSEIDGSPRVHMGFGFFYSN